MKTILFASQTLNGYIADGNGRPPSSKEEYVEFRRIAKESGNLIIGRETFEVDGGALLNSGNYEGIEVIVVSKTLKSDKVKVVKSPQEALNYVQEKGYERAHVAGGASLNESFLVEKLVDEVWLDIEPRIISKGISFVQDCSSDLDIQLELISTDVINPSIIQAKYKIKH